jgi:hypothetical protein
MTIVPTNKCNFSLAAGWRVRAGSGINRQMRELILRRYGKGALTRPTRPYLNSQSVTRVFGRLTVKSTIRTERSLIAVQNFPATRGQPKRLRGLAGGQPIILLYLDESRFSDYPPNIH